VRPRWILAVNSGSSTLKYALYKASGALQKVLAGRFDRPGAQGVPLLVRQLREAGIEGVDSIGYRIAFAGPRLNGAVRIDRPVIDELFRWRSMDPEHLPAALSVINACRRAFPRCAHVACFDSAFHRDLPAVARLLPIPRRYAKLGARRLGFHGLSFAYLCRELERLDPAAFKGRTVLAHLGSGASLAALKAGRCVDTSMAFTPNSGLVMSTRSGDLDPGAAAFVARTGGLTSTALQRLLNAQSGLLAISGTSGDMRELLARQARDLKAAEAVDYFCYQARKWIGAFAAALGGLDGLVFSGGIGERSPEVRRRICLGLEFIGIQLHPARNKANTGLLSSGPVRVRVIATDEERMIAETVLETLA